MKWKKNGKSSISCKVSLKCDWKSYGLNTELYLVVLAAFNVPVVVVLVHNRVAWTIESQCREKFRFSRTFFLLFPQELARRRRSSRRLSEVCLCFSPGSVCFFQSSSKLSSTRFLGQDIQHYQLFSESSIMFGRIEQVFCEVCWGKTSFNVKWNEHRTSSSGAQLSTRLDTNKQSWTELCALLSLLSCLFLYFSFSRWLSIYRH